MSFAVVAKKDFLDAIRAKVFWAISAVFILLMVGLGALFAYIDSLGGELTTVDLVQFLFTIGLPLFISVTALVICHRAVAGERESGSLRLLLSLPHTRLDVVVGKLIGRTGVLSVPVFASIVLSVLVAAIMGVSLSIIPLLVLLAISLLFVFVYVSLFVGLSSLTSSTTLVLAIGFVQFILFEIVWGTIVDAFYIFWWEIVPVGSDFENYALYWTLQTVQPSNATERVLKASLEAVEGGTYISVPPDTFWGTPWFGLVVLAVWAIVPLAVGYARFSTTDL